jgi:hypothetical protein
MTRTTALLAIILATALGQTERWVYRYSGTGTYWDEAYKVVVGGDGNIYTAGYSYGSGTGYDFTVISLTAAGGQRWVYRYNGPGDSADCALALAYGADGNIYAAGYSYDSLTGSDFTVVSLTQAGDQRWVYRYSGPGDSADCAYSVTCGSDGNVYAAGSRYGTGTGYDFAVICLNSADGNQRWGYRYNGPAGGTDCAYSVGFGADGKVYAAGMSTGSGTYGDFTVISLDPAGSGIAGTNSEPEEDAPGLEAAIRGRALSYSLRLVESANVSLAVYDLQGRKLAGWQVHVLPGTSEYVQSLPQLSAGVYFLSARTPGVKSIGIRKLITIE